MQNGQMHASRRHRTLIQQFRHWTQVQTRDQFHNQLFDGTGFGCLKAREALFTFVIVLFEAPREDVPVLGPCLAGQSNIEAGQGSCPTPSMGTVRMEEVFPSRLAYSKQLIKHWMSALTRNKFHRFLLSGI